MQVRVLADGDHDTVYTVPSWTHSQPVLTPVLSLQIPCSRKRNSAMAWFAWRLMAALLMVSVLVAPQQRWEMAQTWPQGYRPSNPNTVLRGSFFAGVPLTALTWFASATWQSICLLTKDRLRSRLRKCCRILGQFFLWGIQLQEIVLRGCLKPFAWPNMNLLAPFS